MSKDITSFTQQLTSSQLMDFEVITHRVETFMNESSMLVSCHNISRYHLIKQEIAYANLSTSFAFRNRNS